MDTHLPVCSGGRATKACLAYAQEGLAMLMAILALSVFSLIGLYGVFNASTELKISDNYEAQVQAVYAAKSGLNHAREILKGLNFNDLLKGPDGTNNSSPAYLNQARTFGFRNFVDWTRARSLNVLDPISNVSGLPDDGLVNTGRIGSADGIVLIPGTGIAFTAKNPYEAGTITTARYFVKVSDNNGEVSELSGDPADDPFLDGDGEVIIRSVGIARTIRETAGASVRRNSVAVYEGRFRRRSTFDLSSPVVVQGTSVSASSSNMFSGNAFNVEGGASNIGLSTIDPNLADGTTPVSSILGNLAPNQYGNIEGMGLSPSLSDITAGVQANPDQSLLLDANYLYSFVNNTLPKFADNVYVGNQTWDGGNTPNLGTFDPALPYNAPSQDPKVTLVQGDLNVSGDVSGGGVLVVTGKFYGSGSFNFNGIVLVIGAGEVDISGLNKGFYGGLYCVNLVNSGNTTTFGIPKLSVGGNSVIAHDSSAIKMGLTVLPASMIGWREVTSAMDP